MFQKQAVETIHLSAQLTDGEAANHKGMQMDESHADLWIKDKTVEVFVDGQLLLVHVAKAIDSHTHQEAYPDLRKVAKNKPTRAEATGLSQQPTVRQDGSLSKTKRIDRNHPSLEFARDGNMGAFEDTLNKAAYCRKNKTEVYTLPAVANYIRAVDDVYKLYAPEHYARQLAAAREIRPEWSIVGAISTTTVNWCFNTRCHRDRSDYKFGMGAITCWYLGQENPVWTIFPQSRVAVLIRPGDLLLSDVGNQWHANSLPQRVPGYGTTNGRLAAIFYLRPGLLKCGSAETEALRRETYWAAVKAKKAARQ